MTSINITSLMEKLTKLEKHIIEIKAELKIFQKNTTEKKNFQDIEKVRAKIIKK